MPMWRHLILCLLLVAPAVFAGTGYKCVSSSGSVSFQDKPCAGATQQQAFDYQDAPPLPDKPPPIAAKPPEAPDEPAAPPPPPPVAAPDFYTCYRFDGTQYYSDTGLTRPYTVPLGIIGYPQTSLHQAYTGPGRVGLSAPESSRPATVAPDSPQARTAAANTYVQDQCYRLPAAEACAALRSEHDAVRAKAAHSFREDRPPLDAREKVLEQKLAGC
jgi:hypothetical protein